MNEAGDGDGGGGAPPADTKSVLGDNGTPPADTPPADTPPAGDPVKEFWCDITPKFPEGFPDEYKTNPGLKPFVSKEGDINVNNMFKSYLHTKSMVGAKDLVKLPGENAPDEERAEFFQKLGHVKDLNEYKVELPEGSKVAAEFVDKMKEVLHKNFVPPKVANELVKFLDEQTSSTAAKMEADSKAKVIEFNAQLQKEFGDALGERSNMAKKLIKETLGDNEADLAVFNDPMIGSNPAVFRLITKLAQAAYAEDQTNSSKGSGSSGRMTPAEAVEEINRIRGDKDDAFNKPSHPSYQDRQKYVLNLYKMKNAKA